MDGSGNDRTASERQEAAELMELRDGRCALDLRDSLALSVYNPHLIEAVLIFFCQIVGDAVRYFDCGILSFECKPSRVVEWGTIYADVKVVVLHVEAY